MFRIDLRIMAAGMTLLGLAAASPAYAQTAYAISNGGDTLIRFDIATPGSLTTIGTLSGAVTRLDGLDFRLANGQLYGYDAVTNQIVTVDPATALTTLASTPPVGADTFNLGIDFEPTTDALRRIDTQNQNLLINPDTGATISGGSLAYAAGDPNAGINPFVIEAAYTNNDLDPATGTQLYYIDYSLDTLVTTADPDSGVLITVGDLGVNTFADLGFDIVTGPNGVNTAYALLDLDEITSSLYTINLQTGAATFLSDLTGDNSVFFPYSLAIVPAAPADVPEPGIVPFGVVAAGSALGLLARRRKAAHKAA